MSNQDVENLKDLFEKFLNSEEAEKAAEDIIKGERIFHSHPAPGPDGRLVSDIKMTIAAALQRGNTSRRTFYRATAFAAAVIILAAIGVRLFDKGGGKPERFAADSTAVVPGAVWESNDIAGDDTKLTILAVEIEQIEDEVLALKLGENGDNGYSDLAELEIELMEINGDFWKG